MWQCPDCGRSFKNKNQWHSCVKVDVDSHFTGKPEKVRVLFDKLVDEVKGFGSVRLDAVKSEVLLGNKSHFAAVQVRRGWLTVSFVLDRLVSDPRITWSMELTGASFEHKVKVERLEDIDEQLLGWLKEVYVLHS